jgi:tRNA(Ile)-lysidine synthase
VSGPTPAVAAVRVAVRRSLAPLPAGAHVVVACSGGPDSLALAAATAFVAPRAGLTAGAVVVDHGWHPASAAVAASAAEACARLGLAPAQVLDVTAAAASGRGGPEAAARDARYAALERAAEEQGAAAVLLGHTLDDQGETVLLGLARGAGARSLAGMRVRRGRFVRPLLDVARATTRRACADLGLEPHDDPANADPAYTRVRVRDALALLEEALGPGLPAALARTAEQLTLDAEALEGFASELLRAAGRADGYDAAVLRAAPDAVRRRALLAAARAAGSPAGSLGSRHVLALDGLVVRQPGASRPHAGVHLPGGLVAVLRCGTLSIAAPGEQPSQPVE